MLVYVRLTHRRRRAGNEKRAFPRLVVVVVVIVTEWDFSENETGLMRLRRERREGGTEGKYTFQAGPAERGTGN